MFDTTLAFARTFPGLAAAMFLALGALLAGTIVALHEARQRRREEDRRARERMIRSASQTPPPRGPAPPGPKGWHNRNGGSAA